MANIDQKQVGIKFSAVNGDQTGRHFYKLIVQESATAFANLVETDIDGNNSELVGNTARIPAGYTFFAGAELYPSKGRVFSRVNISAGSCIGYED